MAAVEPKSLHNQMFDADRLRQDLALRGDLSALKQTYRGSHSEVEISTNEKWDELANMEPVPEIRIRRLTRVAQIAEKSSNALDIGPGWGDIIPILESKNPDLHYTGIDFSRNVIKRLTEKYPTHRFFCGSIADLTDTQYDLILILEVLEHIVPSRVLGFLGQVNDRLAPGGELIITIPIDENLEEFTFVCGACGQPVNKMGHVRVYSKELIKAELELTGFKVAHEELMYIGYYGVKGRLKRHLRNLLGRLVGPTDFKPAKSACVILKCVKADS